MEATSAGAGELRLGQRAPPEPTSVSAALTGDKGGQTGP